MCYVTYLWFLEIFFESAVFLFLPLLYLGFVDFAPVELLAWYCFRLDPVLTLLPSPPRVIALAPLTGFLRCYKLVIVGFSSWS